MNEGISREELKAIIETQSKATEQMVLVARTLNDILTEQRKVAEKLSNGIVKEFTEVVEEKLIACTDGLKKDFETILVRQDKVFEVAGKAQDKVEHDIPEIRDGVKEMKDDIKFTKWFIGAIGLVVIVATVLIRSLDERVLNEKNVKLITSAIHQAKVESGHAKE